MIIHNMIYDIYDNINNDMILLYFPFVYSLKFRIRFKVIISKMLGIINELALV